MTTPAVRLGPVEGHTSAPLLSGWHREAGMQWGPDFSRPSWRPLPIRRPLRRTEQPSYGIVQLVLPGYEELQPEAAAQPASVRVTRTGSRQPEPRTGTQSDPLLQLYMQRLAANGAAERGRAAYQYQLQILRRIVARQAGHAVTLGDLYRDPPLLGHAVVDDKSVIDGSCLSRWTLAQRRSAIRSFTTMMRPELETLIGQNPHFVLNRALRFVAERVGTGYRLTGGTPRRRGGTVPHRLEVAAVLEAAGRSSGYDGMRNRSFFTILAQSGARVNALRMLDGSECIQMPSHRIRLFLHEKGKSECREIELSNEAAALLQEYVRAYNLMAVVRGWATRIGVGCPGPIWRNSCHGHWSYGSITATLRNSCITAGVPSITPHAFRRAFATDVATDLSRHEVAQAGGWRGLERLDDHYICPHVDTVWRKLGEVEQSASVGMFEECSS